MEKGISDETCYYLDRYLLLESAGRRGERDREIDRERDRPEKKKNIDILKRCI